MAKKLFISNLDFEVTGDELKELFSTVGAVASSSIALERETKRSKGFGFIEMNSDDDAKKAIETLNGKVLRGRPIKVNEDRGKGGGFAASMQSGGNAEGGEERRGEPLPALQRAQLFKKKKKLDPFIEDPSVTIDYKNTAILSKFLSERGKLLSRRLTGLTAYNQRRIAKAVKQAQNAGLLSFGND